MVPWVPTSSPVLGVHPALLDLYPAFLSRRQDMSADPIIYCLERVTDYRQFERLSSDLMAGNGYSNIEPLGGSSDRGRDALHRHQGSASLTIFAYTVRRDWQQKLNEDCDRIREENHNPNALVFVCTSSLTSAEKDRAKSTVLRKYGWELEIFELERIRVLLAGPSRHLVARHPAIFCPPWFPTQGGISIAPSFDTIVIDHSLADHALATWLAQRLSLAGFNTWCHGTAPLAGQDVDTSVRALIENRASQYLPILSPHALSEPSLMARCGAAIAKDNFVLPCWAANVEKNALSSRLQSLEPARFHQGWSTGLRDVVEAFDGRGVVPTQEANQRRLGLRTHLFEQLVKGTPERVFSNVFSVAVPKSIVVSHLRNAIGMGALEQLRQHWACVEASPKTLLSFERPPELPVFKEAEVRELAWEDVDQLGKKNPVNVVKELLWRSMGVACVRSGLVWCDHRMVYYFPTLEASPLRNVSLRHVDGRATHVGVTGERQQGWGERATRFRYQLGPRFNPWVDEEKRWWMTMRIYVRVTELDGTPFEGKDIGRRRKTVTKGWWNKEWLARTLGLIQALENGPQSITVGEDHRSIVVSTTPMEWNCPVSIDVVAVDNLGDFAEEMAAIRDSMDEESEEQEVAEETVESAKDG